jgi:transposase-like protein
LASEAEPHYLTVAQVARRLGCTVSLVQKWRRLGWLHPVRLGPAAAPVYGYDPAEVDDFATTRWNRRRGRPPSVMDSRASPKPAEPHPRLARVPAHSPQPPAPSATRPLALYDADPRSTRALILARFRPDELPYALSLAAAWAHRYDTLALGEPATLDHPHTIIALWHNGKRTTA